MKSPHVRTASNPIRAVMQEEARKPSGASVGIPPRNVVFRHPQDAPTYFAFDGNTLATSLFVVFSGIFPPGERFFAASVRRFRERIGDATLKAQVSGFMGQESIHGREHERLNELFAARGFDMSVPDRTIRFSLSLLERLSPTQQLACTTFMEHFTACLAEQWLTNEDFRRGADPEMLKLWYWHALEELEHKSVAFDVHSRVSGSHAERVLAAPLVVGALLPGIAYSWAALVAARDERFELRQHARGLAALFGRDGFLTRTLAHVPDYFARGFHPSQHDTAALEREWQEKLLGGEGMLRAEYRNRATAAA